MEQGCLEAAGKLKRTGAVASLGVGKVADAAATLVKSGMELEVLDCNRYLPTSFAEGTLRMTSPSFLKSRAIKKYRSISTHLYVHYKIRSINLLTPD
jgi:hypothetical protein